ncbi:MAG: class I SAM-dependent methyltransferase [Chitinispirillaceae bacterium]
MNEFDRKAREWDKDSRRETMALAVAEGIRKRVPLSKQMISFEYGCGTGNLSFALKPYLGHIVLADSSEGMLEVTQEKIAGRGLKSMEVMKIDLTTDRPPAAKFDLIYSQMTLHHVEDVPQILKVFAGMLNKPGYLCIADLDKEDGGFHGENFSGHKGFCRSELTRMAQAAGFRDTEISTALQIPRQREDGSTREYSMFLLTAAHY